MEHDNALAVAERLPPDLMLLKMENDSIMAIARATPRDPLKIVGQLQQLIDAYPAAADEAIYRKPVGTAIEVTCGGCGIKYEVNKIETDTACPSCESTKIGPTRKVKKFAEGLSVRAAESIRSVYGYTRLATTTEELPDGKVKLTGVLVDYAAGNLTSDERIVSPMYRSRGGKMERTPEDRFLNTVVKAEKAKLRRDVILDNTPNIVKAMFKDACDKKLEALVAPEVIEQKIIPAFAAYGITREHLDQIVGRPAKLGWREEERLELRKILNALKSNETTARDILEGLNEPAKPSASANGGASIDDLAKPADKPAKTQGPVASETEPNQPADPPQEKQAPAALHVEFGRRISAAKTAQDFEDITAAIADSGLSDEIQGQLAKAMIQRTADLEADAKRKGKQKPLIDT
jgi:predicted Zn-ribbon and HTH transcriptional regulator